LAREKKHPKKRGVLLSEEEEEWQALFKKGLMLSRNTRRVHLTLLFRLINKMMIAIIISSNQVIHRRKRGYHVHNKLFIRIFIKHNKDS
jgi:hypothetical protein